MTIYHIGDHSCEAKKTIGLNEDELKKFEGNSKASPRKAADIIIDALLGEGKSWDDVKEKLLTPV